MARTASYTRAMTNAQNRPVLTLDGVTNGSTSTDVHAKVAGKVFFINVSPILKFYFDLFMIIKMIICSDLLCLLPFFPTNLLTLGNFLYHKTGTSFPTVKSEPVNGSAADSNVKKPQTEVALSKPKPTNGKRKNFILIIRSCDTFVALCCCDLTSLVQFYQDNVDNNAKKGKKGKKPKKGERDLNELKRELVMDEHQIPLEDLQERFTVKSLDNGLDSGTVKRRLEEEGLNRLTPPPTTPEWIKFLRQMTGGFALLLWIGAILSWVIYGISTVNAEQDEDIEEDKLYLGVVLALVVIVTGCFSYYQEGRAANVMKDFEKLQPQKAKVRRDGQVALIDAVNIVRGDVVEVKAGDRIPADLRIFESQNLKV